MKVTVIGELCKDVFIYGECKRLSPEAPVPVLTPIHKTENNGMAGNVVSNLLSINPSIEVPFYHQQRELTKTRYVDSKSNHMFLRVDTGEDTPVMSFYMSDEFILDLKTSSALIVSDYDKGFLSEISLLNISRYCGLNILDSKKKLSEDNFKNFDFIKLNEIEFLNNENLVNQYKEKVLVTLGHRGVLWNDKIYNSKHPKETIDVSGAGDTFIAAFTIKYLETKDVEQSIVFANEMAGIVVTKRGVTTPL